MPISNDYFPALSTRTPTVPPTKSGVSFSALASEWNEKSEEDAIEREARQETMRNLAVFAEAERRAFVPMRREYNSNEDYVYADEAEKNTILPEDDGWKVVEKKVRKEWSIDEQIERKQRYEAEVDRQKEEGSVWTTGDHRHEDWGFRDRRTA
jgi:hypothetical protein